MEKLAIVKKLKFTPEGEPETPYQRAKQEFDDFIGAARVQAANWRLIAFGELGVIIVLLIGFIFLALNSSVVPYIVEVNEHGAVNLVGRADKLYRPNEAATEYFLGQFVTQIRSIPTDAIIMRHNYLSSYNFLTPKGSNTLNAYAKEWDPFKQLGKRAVSVEVSSAVKMSENSYQVNWYEQDFESNGTPSTRQAYTGIFNLVFHTPKDEKLLRTNPLGIFIDFFNISKVN